MGSLKTEQSFSEFLESIWRSGQSDVGLSEFAEPKVSSKVELTVDDGLHGFEQVGLHPKTKWDCGTYLHHLACSDLDAHAGVVVDGVDCTGKGYGFPIFRSCDKPTCEKCFRDGWARRGGYKIALRLKAFTAQYGEVYHIIASIPPSDYDLPYDVQVENTRKALAKRHVIGGLTMPHAVRGDKRKFSMHFHCLAFIEKGYYDGCRHCVGADCHKCDGFEGLTMRLNKGDGKRKGDVYIIKVLSQRNKSYTSDEPNVGGTAFYQLTHASVLKNVNRFHVWTYFGVCGYNKRHADVVVKKKVCLICAKGLSKYAYTGSRPMSDFKGISAGRLQDCLIDVEENGVRVYREIGSEDCKPSPFGVGDGIGRNV